MPYSAEFPIRKYFTHPRRIGLITSITFSTGCDLQRRNTSLSSRSNPVRFFAFPGFAVAASALAPSARAGSQNPRIRKLSPFTRSTTRLLASFSARPSSANSSRSRRSIAVSNHSGRRSPSTRITSRVGRWRGDDQGVRGQAVSPLSGECPPRGTGLPTRSPSRPPTRCAPGVTGRLPPSLLRDRGPRRQVILHAPATREAQDEHAVGACVETPAPASSAPLAVRALLRRIPTQLSHVRVRVGGREAASRDRAGASTVADVLIRASPAGWRRRHQDRQGSGQMVPVRDWIVRPGTWTCGRAQLERWQAFRVQSGAGGRRQRGGIPGQGGGARVSRLGRHALHHVRTPS